MARGRGRGLGLGLGAQSQRRNKDMILVYEIPSDSTNIKLAIQANSSWFSTGQAAVINWGDGSANETVSDTGGSTYIEHTYTAAGTYTIKISGSMTMYGRAPGDNIAGQAYLTRVDSFGKLGITSLAYAFLGCTGLTSVPKTLPSNVTSMSYMFRSCNGSAFNPDVSNWDVSKVENMSSMFRGCSHTNFRGGRGADGLGVGIANWIPKSLLTGTSIGLSNFMLSALAQDATYLDSILNAWAALIGDPVNPLPTQITCHFGTTKYTSAGADSFALLTAPISSGGAAWTITSGGLQA